MNNNKRGSYGLYSKEFGYDFIDDKRYIKSGHRTDHRYYSKLLRTRLKQEARKEIEYGIEEWNDRYCEYPEFY